MPDEPARGETVTLDGSPSTDPDGEISAYRWDLDNDGSYEATGERANHTYFLSGRKRVALTVEDEDGGSDTTTGYVEVQDELELELDESAIEHKLAAYRDLNRSTYRGLEDENLTGKIRRTFQYFIHPNRVTKHTVFELEQEVAGPMQTRNQSVTNELAAADRILAIVAIRDVKRAKEILDNRSVDYDENEVDKNLREAENHFERGLRFRSGPQSVVAEIAQYKESWNASQNALDVLDQVLAPQILLSSRNDPNHAEPINYSVQGRIFDVRPWAITNVSISVNGEERVADVFPEAQPVANGSFSASIRLTQQVNRVTITATDRFNNTGETRLLLDGDGLPDRYEQKVTTTDPLDPDSDADATDRDESDNGVRDGNEDFDRDDLETHVERRLGTHPLKNDTDGDGLSDGYEVMVTPTEPLVTDSDDDGVEDGLEDPDGDGLTNLEEQSAGTDPNSPDSDGDGLRDPRELEIGTDPWSADSDDDFLEDGDEVEAPFNTDPLDPDTDDDGVPDGHETYTTSTSGANGDVVVAVTGEGNAAERVTISEPSNVIFGKYQLDAAVSPTHDINVSGTMSQATISIRYNTSRVEDTSNLSIYRYNETIDEYERLPSTVNADANRVSANVTQFSKFTVFSHEEYGARVREAEEFYETLDAARASCASGSRETYNASEYPPSDLPKVVEWVPSESIQDEQGVDLQNVESFPFGTGWTITEDTSTTVGSLYYISGRVQGDSKYLTKLLADNPYYQKGRDDNAGTLVEEDRMHDLAGISLREGAFNLVRRWAFGKKYGYRNPVNDSGIANESDYALLSIDERSILSLNDRWVAMRAGDWQYAVVSRTPNGTVQWLRQDGSVSESPVIFEAEFYVDLAYEHWLEGVGGSGCEDSDGDTIPDYVENIDDIPLSNGPRIDLNASSAFTDEDALQDQEEINWEERKVTGLGWDSNPNSTQTDGDGLPDDDEVLGWEINVSMGTYKGVRAPMRWNESSPEQIHVESNPKRVDSDGDEIPDHHEFHHTHTNPLSEDTYLITDIQQVEIINRLHAMYEDPDVSNSALNDAARAMHLLQGLRNNPDVPSAVTSVQYFDSVELTDGTTDFDFVRADNGDIVFRSYADGNQASRNRSDTWLAYPGEKEHTDHHHWDPDADDDGLTDGQEVHGITKSDTVDVLQIGGETVHTGLLGLETDTANTYNTDPLDPDSDGDGYWDGWIGVYGVGRSDNVVQYMENLRDAGNDGVAGEEIVQEQAGIHRVDGTEDRAAATSTRVFKANDTRYHSNLHVGELQWRTDPNDDSSRPDLSFTVEVDYYDAPNATYLDTPTWRGNIERNLALYGIEATLSRHENISQQDIDNSWFVTASPPFSSNEAADIEDEFRDQDKEAWMFVANNSTESNWGFTGNGGLAGISSPSPDATTVLGREAVRLATTPGLQTVIDEDLGNDLEEARNATRAGSALHELGHVLNTGEADERETTDDEVYSGWPGGGFPGARTPEDLTRENIRSGSTQRDAWSIMRKGWENELLIPPYGDRHPNRNEVKSKVFTRFAYSIEELTTIKNDQIID